MNEETVRGAYAAPLRPRSPLTVAAALRDLATSTAVILAAWGALGGATNALTTRMRLRDALRHILLGGLIAAGMGSLSMAVITAWLGLPSQAIPAGGAAGSAAYLVGVFGPAFIEVVLARLRSGKWGSPDAWTSPPRARHEQSKLWTRTNGGEGPPVQDSPRPSGVGASRGHGAVQGPQSPIFLGGKFTKVAPCSRISAPIVANQGLIRWPTV
jgi:hypothetical protein